MSILTIIQIVVSVVLIFFVLIQSKGKGFGRSTNVSFTRRGLEQVVFKFTFVLTFIFIAISIFQFVL